MVLMVLALRPYHKPGSPTVGTLHGHAHEVAYDPAVGVPMPCGHPRERGRRVALYEQEPGTTPGTVSFVFASNPYRIGLLASQLLISNDRSDRERILY